MHLNLRDCIAAWIQVGYDPETEEYPEWLKGQPYASLLPQVKEPGALIGHVTREIASTFGE